MKNDASDKLLVFILNKLKHSSEVTIFNELWLAYLTEQKENVQEIFKNG